MKVIPITGLEINDNIRVVVQAFSAKKLSKIFGIKEEKEDYVYIDDIVFANRSNLETKIDNSQEVKEILKKFPQTETFAIINTRLNKYTEFYDLKVALSIIYIAYRSKMETYSCDANHFGLGVIYGYHTEAGIQSTKWHISIGTKLIDENYYDLTIPVYYTSDEEIESWKIPRHVYSPLIVKKDISKNINKISMSIVKPSQMSNKLRSALYLLFNTLNFENIDLVIIMYSTILETLLLSSNEDNQRKKVSVRLVCLIRNLGKCEEKEYIANWVYYFYKYRNDIVHDGKSFIELQVGEEFVIFNHTLSLIQHLIFSLINKIVNNDITTTKDIIKIVEKNIENDNLNNGFEYISQNMIMYYED